jgi:hypothetical protein
LVIKHSSIKQNPEGDFTKHLKVIKCQSLKLFLENEEEGALANSFHAVSIALVSNRQRH